MRPKLDYTPMVEAARLQFEATGQVTMDHLRSALGRPYAPKSLQNVVKRLRGQGVFPWPITRTYVAGLHPNHARLIEAARAEFEATGGTTTGRLAAATGFTPGTILVNVRRLRVRGLYPWPLDGKLPSQVVLDDRDAVASPARNLASLAVAHLRDGRSEVDDPREHGWLAQPRAVPRPQRILDPAARSRRWISHDRKVRARLGLRGGVA